MNASLSMSRCLSPAIMLALAGSLLFGAAGCDDDHHFSHVPPQDYGALVIDNETADDVTVYINGVEMRETDSWDAEAYNLLPGVHRLVLDQQHGDRSYSTDVDILLGKLTVINLQTPSDYSGTYLVTTTYEDPGHI